MKNKFKAFLDGLSDFELKQFRIFIEQNKGSDIRQMTTNNACNRIFITPTYSLEVKTEPVYSIRTATWETKT